MVDEYRGTIEFDEYLGTLWEDLVLYAREARYVGMLIDPEDVYRIVRASFIRRGITPVPMYSDFVEAMNREG